MPSLKDLKNRRKTVESTRKITSAMKMVSAAKLRRAQEQAITARPYAQSMASLVSRIAAEQNHLDSIPPLMAGTGKDSTFLIVLLTSDRGLCGGFNNNLIKTVRQQIQKLQSEGKTLKILCLGRRGKEALAREFSPLLISSDIELGKAQLSFLDAKKVGQQILKLFDTQAFDRCLIIYSHFKSALTQISLVEQLIPFEASFFSKEEKASLPLYEPEGGLLLESLLPRNLETQIFKALIETYASEHGARMTAMDSATRNAGDMIRKLDLTYNRARQAYITKELIEIISGAEAV